MKQLIGLVSIVIPVLLAGCAGAPDDHSALEQTRQELRQLAASEQVRQSAPNVLFEAEEALKRAAAADDTQRREHHLYLARQQMEIARAMAERDALSERITALTEERDQLRVAAREQQLDQARNRAEELEAELAALEARRTDQGYMITLNDLFFETDGTDIQPGTETTLGKIAEFLRQYPDQRITVAGHTDSRGAESYNRQLSRQRADAVKRAIVARGIEPERISTTGHGESRPIASNDNPGGRQLNRRVEIILPQLAETTP